MSVCACVCLCASLCVCVCLVCLWLENVMLWLPWDDMGEVIWVELRYGRIWEVGCGRMAPFVLKQGCLGLRYFLLYLVISYEMFSNEMFSKHVSATWCIDNVASTGNESVNETMPES